MPGGQIGAKNLLAPAQKNGRDALRPRAGCLSVDRSRDCRRKRRALTEDELVRLLDAAHRRPLLEGAYYPPWKEQGRAAGRAQAADEKNRQGSNIPLRADLVAEIRQWLVEKLDATRREALKRRQCPPETLLPGTPVFTVPTTLVKILNRDLVLAGIPKKDGRGWTVDVHAMRHTFGTPLSRDNVAPRTAQAAMRHSSIDLTMNVYTDPRLLDVAGALEKLPDMSLAAESRHEATESLQDKAIRTA